MHRALLPFEFSEPASVEEAVALVDGGRARALAGGVDLVLKMRLRQETPERVVSLQKIAGLDHVRVDAHGGGALHIGALATLRQVEQSAAVTQGWPLLAEAIASIVSMQTKVMGTLVGNLCVGTPASDVAPALFALGARVKIAGVGDERDIAVEDFFLGPGVTAVRPHELVTEVVVPARPVGSAGRFLKLSKTADDIAKVNVAVSVAFSRGTCAHARIAIGSAAPTPVRAVAAEELLLREDWCPATAKAAAEAAARSVRPISDVRSTADYRAEMVKVLVRDALTQAADGAGVLDGHDGKEA